MRKFKKLLFPILFLFLIFTLLETCTASFDVYPRELNITMIDEFLNGNTSEAITVINYDKNESVNISWYLSDPEPISSIRPNRTTIPDLSWIEIEPKWQIIPPNDNMIFYIHLHIPDSFENLNKSWESWITFKSEKTGLFNIEHAVRLYIDTPVTNDEKNINNKSDESINNIIIIATFAFIVIFLAFFLKSSK